MWAKWSYLLQTLTALTPKKVKFKCKVVEQKSFDEIKQIFSRNTLLIYVYLNKRFCIHTDTSEFHLGAVISQNSKPIDFYSRKPTGPQTRYTVTESNYLV